MEKRVFGGMDCMIFIEINSRTRKLSATSLLCGPWPNNEKLKQTEMVVK